VRHDSLREIDARRIREIRAAATLAMSRLEDLPPDLRAALSLLVDRGKSYAEVADLLGIPESAVRERAHAALDALAGPTSANGSAPARADADTLRSAGAGGANGRGGELSLGAGSLPVSRRGGAILLSAIAIVVVVVVVLLTTGGGSSHKSSNASAHGASSTTAGSGKSPRITKQLTLTPHGSSNAIGIAEVLQEGSQHAIYVAAEKLEPSKGFFYVIWLYNSPSHALALGRTPNVGSNGRMQGGALLPSNASGFHQLLLTKETNEHATHPGEVVLSGPFSLGG
jgi:Sigma-70, region 4